jgi:hypothetical protein
VAALRVQAGHAGDGEPESVRRVRWRLLVAIEQIAAQRDDGRELGGVPCLPRNPELSVPTPRCASRDERRSGAIGGRRCWS